MYRFESPEPGTLLGDLQTEVVGTAAGLLYLAMHGSTLLAPPEPEGGTFYATLRKAKAGRAMWGDHGILLLPIVAECIHKDYLRGEEHPDVADQCALVLVHLLPDIAWCVVSSS